MACFTATVVEAIAATAVKKTVEKNEKDTGKIPFSGKLGWLTKMLWGGSALLAFEHVWHGEIVPWFPFLTGDNVLYEIATTGLTMCAAVTGVWLCILGVCAVLERRGVKGDERA